MKIANDIRILIVEDDKVQAEIIQDKLKEFNTGYAMHWFKEGESLLKYLSNEANKKKHYYLILDYYLQTKKNKDALNGLEIINILKDQYPQVNIVLFSAYESDNNTSFEEIKQEANVIDFIKKSEHAYSHVENVIRFHYSKSRLEKKRRRFNWARWVFVSLLFITILHLLYSYYSI